MTDKVIQCVHPPYFIACSVFKERYIQLIQLELNAMLDTDLFRLQQT